MRRLIYFGKIVMVILLICLIGGTALLYFNQDKIGNLLLDSVKSGVRSNIEIESVHLNLFENFPLVSADLIGIQIDGLNETPFLEADHLYLYVNPLSLLFDELKIKKLKLSNSRVQIQKLEEGFNYKVFGKENPDENSEGVVFQIEKAVLEDVDVLFIDEPAGIRLNTSIKSAIAKGVFSNDYITCSTEAKMFSRYLSVHNQKYAEGSEMWIDGSFSINLDKQFYQFKKLQIGLNGNAYDFAGNIRDWNDHISYDLEINCLAGKTDRLIETLPKAYRKIFDTYSVSGPMKAHCSINGRSGQTQNPFVNLDLKVHDAKISSTFYEDQIDHTSFDLNFNNGGARQGHSSKVEVQNLSGSCNGKPLTGNLQIKNFSFPSLDVELSGHIPATILNTFSAKQGIVFSEGDLDLENFQINDLWIDLVSPISFMDAMEADFAVQEVKLTYRDMPLTLESGKASLKKANTNLENVRILQEETDMTISGSLDYLAAAIEMQKPEVIQYDLKVDAKAIHIDLEDRSTANVKEREPGEYYSRFVKGSQIELPKGEMELKARQFKWGDKDFKNLHVTGRSNSTQISAEVKSGVNSGQVDGEIEVYVDDRFHWESKIEYDGIDLHDCFEEWENFGQEVVTSKHLKGDVSGLLWMEGQCDRKGNLVKKSLHLMAGMEITEGRLQNLKMLNNFSKYIHSDDLENIKFEKLQNFVEIRHGNVYIPAMFIQSNAANLTVNGIHTLDNKILYNIKVNAGQILGKKLKNHDPSLKSSPARKDGFINLYYTIFGDIQNYKYQSDKKGVTSSFQQSEEIKQRVNVKLEKVFGHSLKWHEPSEWEDIPEFSGDDDGPVEFLEEIKIKGKN